MMVTNVNVATVNKIIRHSPDSLFSRLLISVSVSSTKNVYLIGGGIIDESLVPTEDQWVLKIKSICQSILALILISRTVAYI